MLIGTSIMLNLYFLGKTRIECNGKSVSDNFRNKTIALICLLVLNHHKHLSREKILDYLWPDSSEEAAKNNLRYNLWLIKKSIGPNPDGEEFLIVNKEYCGINKKYVFQCDILDIMNFRFQQAESIENLLRLKRMFTGEFFEGFYYNNCEDFNEIIIFQRTRFEKYEVQILKKLEMMYEEEGNIEECLDTIKEILDIEPYDEDSAAKILDLYLITGNRSSGIVFYNSFRDRLVNRLGIQPSDILRKKYEELKKSTEIKVNVKDFKEKRIHTICVRDIPYFWMSDVIGKLFEQEELFCESRVNENMIGALGYIQPAILSDHYSFTSAEIPSVQIVNAFIKLVTELCKDFQLSITIQFIEEIDPISAGALQYLKYSNIASLSFIET